MKIDLRHIHLPRINVKIDWRVLGSRLAAAAGTYLVSRVVSGGVPRDAQGLYLTGAGALGAVVLAAPNAFAAAGILKAVSPGSLSLAQGVAQAISSLAAAPANARKAAFQAAVADEMRTYTPLVVTLAAQEMAKQDMAKTGQFAPGQLATSPTSTDGQPVTTEPVTTEARYMPPGDQNQGISS